MLNDEGVPFVYREYTEDPLSRAELATLFGQLKRSPRELLRPSEVTALGLDGSESDERLLDLMTEHPALLQRPIGVLGNRALLGRPPEDLLALLD